MSVTIVANKQTQEILEVSGLKIDLTVQGNLDKYKSALSTNHGIAVENISLKQFANGTTEQTRLKNGDDYSVTWNKNEISGLDFAQEDCKCKFTVSSNKTEMIAGETVEITVTMYECDGTTPKTDVNSSFKLPVSSLVGSFCVAMQFSSGVATKVITLNNPGTYTFGAVRKDSYVLTGSTPTVEVDL